MTLVAPLFIDAATGKATKQTVFTRGALESRSDAEHALAEARLRTPRLPLVEEGKARGHERRRHAPILRQVKARPRRGGSVGP